MRAILIVLGVSLAISLILVMVGIFWKSRMVMPMEGMNYGLVIEMFSSPSFQKFHLEVFMWLFSASAISSSTTLYLVHITRRSSKDAQRAPLS
ncbi:hypothetical protein [Neptuniibacter sp. QD37_11]|uniref:hypothetical protein n=1 Tax=Neptuniibacter sp. QD37_11 TaxID=3398209 RepID=UPI0039F620A7